MKNEKTTLIILTGPTAVGKTALSIKLAKAVDGEIISADSMQVYRHMDIGIGERFGQNEMQGSPTPSYRYTGAGRRVSCCHLSADGKRSAGRDLSRKAISRLL